MKAVGYQENLSIDHKNALVDIELPTPKAIGKDILVAVKAVSVNPVDYKVRLAAKSEPEEWKVLGWDAAGIVAEVGDDVVDFKVGDSVYYAGDITRSGSNAQYHLVDERIVGHMPKSLSFAEAAALPLTSLTAWELLFDRMEIDTKNANKSILVIGAAGGVGSVLVQLLKQKTQLTVVGTASRSETATWLQNLGVDYVINHKNKLSDEYDKLALAAPDYVVSLNATEHHFDEIVKIIKPQGKFGLIDDPSQFNIMPLKSKAVATYFEFMFTRSMFQTADIRKQQEILNQIAYLIDEKVIKTTVGQHLGTLNSVNLKKAHAMLESGTSKGKIVLEVD